MLSCMYLSDMLHGVDEFEWGQLLGLRDVRDVEVPLDLTGGKAGINRGTRIEVGMYMNRCKV